MDGSILLDTKKVLGLESTYTAFDPDVLIHINGALSTLNQIGIGPEGGLYISDSTAIWSDLSVEQQVIALAKPYVYLRVRLAFDPPATSFVLKAMEEQLRELEWRLSSYREAAQWTPPPSDKVPGVLVIDGGQP